MKLKHTLSLLSLATCAALSTSAFAQSTVTFNGKIVDQACASIVANGGNAVTLDQRSVSDFPAVGTLQASTPFSVVLNECSPIPGTFAVNFSNSSADAQGRITTTGVAGIGYALSADALGANLIPFTATANNSTGAFDANTPQVAATTAGPHTLSYFVHYIRLGAVGTGDTTATATMTVQYD